MPHDVDDSEFISRASARRQTLARELLDFMRENRKWWLAPLIITMVGLGTLAVLGGTGAAPFIYSLF